jgi:tyrosine-protein phosphatase SIW14
MPPDPTGIQKGFTRMQSQQYIRRRAALLTIIGSLAAASASAAIQDASLPNFQQVNDHVYRGAQPSANGFRELAQLGIKTVIDLRQIGEHSQADEQKLVTNLGMRYVSIPMAGMSTPKDDQVTAVLALLKDTTSGPVFVHCKRGADRTGMVVAVYRIAQDGWENKKALSEAKSYGMSFFQRAIQQYVLNFKPSRVLASAGAASASPVPQMRGASQ